LRHRVRTRRHAVHGRHPSPLWPRAHRLRTGHEGWPGPARPLHRRSTCRARDDRDRTRFPDERHSVRAGQTDLPHSEADEELANEHAVRPVGVVSLAVATLVPGFSVPPFGAAATDPAPSAVTRIARGDWPTYGH